MVRKSYSILIISILNHKLNIDNFRDIIDSPGSWQKNATENIISGLIYGLSRNASLSLRKFRRSIYIPTFKLIITLPECGYTCYLGKSVRTALYQWYTTVNSLWHLIGISYCFSSPFSFCFKASNDTTIAFIYMFTARGELSTDDSYIRHYDVRRDTARRSSLLAALQSINLGRYSCRC